MCLPEIWGKSHWVFTEPVYLLLHPELDLSWEVGILGQPFPPCWVCHARTCCLPVLKTVEYFASTYTHPSPSIAWDTDILLRAVTYIYTRVYTCIHACYPHRCTTTFLSTWLLQGDAIKVFLLRTWHWSGEDGGFAEE